jgi:cell division protease FtsH
VLNIQPTGTENDIEKASDLARMMVCEYGMSEELGPLPLAKRKGRYSWAGSSPSIEITVK